MDTEMNQASLTCPMCKRVNEPGTRFCRSCGRLLIEPHQEDSEAEHAPLYESQGALPVVEVMPVESARPTVPMDMTHARLIIRLLPPEGDSGASASAPRIGEYTLDGRTITVGRTQGCDIIFDGDTLTSRRHAILRFDGARYVLADLGSSNGTFINDVEITTPTALKHGDRILIGEHELLFLLDQARPIAAAATQVNAPARPPATAVALEAPPEALAALAAVAAAEPDAEPDAEPQAPPAQAASETAQAAHANEAAQTSEADQASVAGDGENRRATTGLPRDGATAKYASVSRLSSELAASASRMVAPPRDGQDDAEMAAIRQRLLEASDALARQAALQAALAERRRAVLVETREHVADLLADLRGDDTVANSPVQHKREIGLIELVDAVAANPNNRERVYELVQRADELAHALRALAPNEGRWSYERNHTVRNLEDMLYRLRDLP